MTTTNKAALPPIGKLLVTLDGLINDQFDHAIAAHGITRRQWQLLNTLDRAPATIDDLTEAVLPFLDTAAAETALPHLEPLAAQGLIAIEGDVCSLTAHGRERFTTTKSHVHAIRGQILTGLEEGEYEATVTSLQKMIQNLRP
ncbi:MarR family winged helix-turn-helix transcriptional regulator [Glycomyces sp. NPDC047010]|uniref:MarR family winged helix-turn-helix transcriptional regulator n=1 Tax=Glycomyces sp. NPDC047010 TaxID=3155023 RepID=UPI0033FFD4FE